MCNANAVPDEISRAVCNVSAAPEEISSTDYTVYNIKAAPDEILKQNVLCFW